MLGIISKSKAKPQKTPPAQLVGTLAADALAGVLTMDLAKGYQLVSVFAAYNAGPATDDAVRAFVDTLVATDPALAGRLVDALVVKVGR